MNSRFLSSAVAVALALTGAGCNKSGKLNAPSTFTPPAGPVELKLKWTAGERVVQDLDMKQAMELNLPGQPGSVKQNMVMGQKYALKVLNQDAAGGHELEMEYLSARMTLEMGGKVILSYDSAKPSPADSKNPVAGVMEKVVGSKIQFFLDASNNVARLVGVDELVNRLSAGGQEAAVAPLKSIFSEGYFKQMMSSSRFLPTKPVQPGDTWPIAVEIPLGSMGTMAMDYTITFQRWETHGKRNCARLEFQGQLKTKPGTAPMSGGLAIDIKDGTTSGISWFDPELGITIDTTMDQDMTMVMTLPGNAALHPGATRPPTTMTNQLSQHLNIKLDSVN